MRTLSILTLTTLLAAPLAGQGNPADPDKKVAGGGTLPAGWSARPDNPTANMADAKVAPSGPGLRVTTGPAVVLWRSADAVTGSFHTLANFTQLKAPTHPEAFGIVVAGKDLNGDASYVYVLIRGDGMYTIRKGGKAGTPSTNLTTGGNANGWLPSAAVVKQDADGKAKNLIEVSGDAATKKLTFQINGQTVQVIDAPAGMVGGIVGLRVNHNLDVQVDGFAVHKIG